MASLITRPRAVRALTEEFDVERVGAETYRVRSHSGNTYTVDVTERSCTCPDHEHREVACKHLLRVVFEQYSTLGDDAGADAAAD